MGHTRTNSATDSGMKQEDSNHFVECTGPVVDGNGWIIWVPTLKPELFFTISSLCGFSVAQELETRCSAVEDLSSVIVTDNIEQFGSRENVRFFGVEEEDVFAKVVSLAEKVGFVIISNGVSAYHRLPNGSKSPKLVITKFVRRDTKHQLMKTRRNLKNTNIFVIDNLTTICARITSELMTSEIVGNVLTVNEKIMVFMLDKERLSLRICTRSKKGVNKLFSYIFLRK